MYHYLRIKKSDNKNLIQVIGIQNIPSNKFHIKEKIMIIIFIHYVIKK